LTKPLNNPVSVMLIGSGGPSRQSSWWNR
jgi:hypothetical protein